MFIKVNEQYTGFLIEKTIMIKKKHIDEYTYKPNVDNILKSLDKDIHKSENILMYGLGAGMFSSLLAPIAPPNVLLPCVALIFVLTTTLANKNYKNMQRQFITAMRQLDYQQVRDIDPLINIFKKHPVQDLGDGFNPLKNLKRTWKSVLGGLFMNPLWMPIFYVMGMHICEEKNVILLHQAIRELESNYNS